MSDLHTVIEDSISDATEPAVTEDSTPEIETQSELTETQTELAAQAESKPDEAPAEEASSSAVQSPAARAAAEAGKTDKTQQTDDEFAKKHGLQPQKAGERENRLPYSAVKRIVGNAEKKATEPLQAQLKDYEGRVTEYEGRLSRVAQFEQIMMTDAPAFLNMLTKIPAYQEIFSRLSATQAAPTGQAPTALAQAGSAQASDPSAEMPQPDQLLADGSRVYSLEGVQKLLDWKANQVEQRVTSTLGKRLEPFEREHQAMEQARQAREHLERNVIPHVQAQITEARKWTQFNENETEIVKALQENPNLSLEGAYRQIVMPKLAASYNTVRGKVLDELKKAPQSTSTAASIMRPQAQPTGPRDMESIILQSIKEAGLSS